VDTPELALLTRARLAAGRLDDAEAMRLVEQFLAGNASSPRQRAIAWEIAADAAFADGDYARASKAARQLQPRWRHSRPTGRNRPVPRRRRRWPRSWPRCRRSGSLRTNRRRSRCAGTRWACRGFR